MDGWKKERKQGRKNNGKKRKKKKKIIIIIILIKRKEGKSKTEEAGRTGRTPSVVPFSYIVVQFFSSDSHTAMVCT